MLTMPGELEIENIVCFLQTTEIWFTSDFPGIPLISVCPGPRKWLFIPQSGVQSCFGLRVGVEPFDLRTKTGAQQMRPDG